MNNCKKIYGGGFSLSSSFFNSISRYISTIKSIGQAAGSALRRLISGKSCGC